jgi:YVTN family beta-propeller protein
MSDTPPPAPTQAALGPVRASVVRTAIEANVQPDTSGIIAPFTFKPPGGFGGWKRVRISNYSPYAFLVVGVPGGGNADPPQIIQPYQSNVWNYENSRGVITLNAAVDESSPLAVPPLRFAYAAGTALGSLLYNFVTCEWTDNPDLFFGYYPVPLTGISITAEGILTPTSEIIPAGKDPLAIAGDPTNNRLYIADNASNTVTVIDTNSGTVVASIPVDNQPQGIACDPATGKVYVACTGAGKVDIISTATLTVVGVLTVAGAYDVTIDFTTGKKFVSDNGTHVFPISAGDVVGAGIAVGNGPQGIGANPATSLVYVANNGDNTVSVIDAVTQAVVGIPIAVGAGPVAVEADPTRNLIFVTNSTAGPPGTVSVINGATALVIHTIAVGNDPIAVNGDFGRGKVYIVNNGSNTVSVIDETSFTVTDTKAPGIGPLADQVLNNRVWVTITAGVVVALGLD